MKLRLFILIFCLTNNIFSKETSSQQEAMILFNKANTYLFEKKDSESAMKFYISSIEKNPSYPQAHFNLGIARAQLKGFLGAIKHFETALKLKPDYYDVYLKTAEIKQKLGQRREAILDYTQYLKFKPNEAEIYLLRCGMIYYYPDACPEREADLKMYIQLKPDSALGYYELAWFHFRFARLDSEMEQIINLNLKKAISLNPLWIDPFFLKARLDEEYIGKDAAIKIYSAILNMYPNNRAALSKRAKLYEEINMLHEAKSDYAELVYFDPKNYEAHLNLGHVYMLLKDYETAEDILSIAIKLLENKYPDLFQTNYYYYRAWTRFQLKNYNGSIEDYDVILKNFKYDQKSLFYYDRATVKKEFKKYADALEDYDNAIKYDSLNEYYLYDRGKTKSLLKDYKGAYEDYTKAIKINSTLGIFYQARAYASIQMNDYQAAKMDLLLASDLLPENKEIHTDLEVLEILLRDSK